MTSDPDDALNWDGDDEARSPATKLPAGWNAVGKGSETVGVANNDDGVAAASADRSQMGNAMLLLLGVVGGVYLLYTVGWIIGGLNTQPGALFLIPSVMFQSFLWAAVLAPALWFAASWILTRHSAPWVRVSALIAGVVLLVPWPFVMTGAVGS